VRRLIREVATAREAAITEPEIAGCWVNPGWSGGLAVDPQPGWPGIDDTHAGGSGLVCVVVARRTSRYRLSVCGYLVDTQCLGVKNALAPLDMHERELKEFLDSYFIAFAAPPSSVPIELAQHLVLGAVEFARGLGFEPHPDFAAARDHLGQWDGRSAPSASTGPALP
jgi:hypothetical protein